MGKNYILTALILMSTAVYAGEIGFETTIDGNTYPNQPITISWEGIDEIKSVKYDLDINSPTTGILNNINIGATITYKPEPASLKTNDFLEIYFTNATTHIDTGNCWLVLDEDKALDTNGDNLPDSMYDLNNDGDFNDLWIIGYTPDFVGQSDKIDFIISANVQLLPNNMVLYIGCQDVTNSSEYTINDVDNDSTTNSDFETEYNLILSLNPSNINDKVCIYAKGYNGFGSRIPNLDAEEKCIIDFENQFEISQKPTISTINIYNPSNGKSFVEKTPDLLISSEDTELNASGGLVKIDNDSDNSVEDYIDLDMNQGNLDLKIWSDQYGCTNNFDYSQNGYKALDFDNQRIFLSGDGNETVDGNRFAFSEGLPEKGINGACSLSLTVGETTGDIAVPHGTVWIDDVYMGVDGTNRMRFVRWQLDESLNILSYSHNLTSKDLLERFFKKWEPNGTTLWAPFLNKWNTTIIISHNNPNKVTQVPASETSTTHDIIEVRAKIWDRDEEWCDNILIAQFTDQGRILIKGKDIWAKAKQKCPTVNINGTFSAMLTISAPERDIEATILQTTKKGIRNLPIYQSKERIDKILEEEDFEDYHN